MICISTKKIGNGKFLRKKWSAIWHSILLFVTGWVAHVVDTAALFCPVWDEKYVNKRGVTWKYIDLRVDFSEISMYNGCCT